MSVILNHGYDHSAFSFSGTVLTAEASTLGYRGPEQLYDDACDVGIAIHGPRGNLIRFYLASRDMSGEDVAGWRFKPISEDCRRHPAVRPLSVLIIND